MPKFKLGVCVLSQVINTSMTLFSGIVTLGENENESLAPIGEKVSVYSGTSAEVISLVTTIL